jgi:hypothetical protein
MGIVEVKDAGKGWLNWEIRGRVSTFVILGVV